MKENGTNNYILALLRFLSLGLKQLDILQTNITTRTVNADLGSKVIICLHVDLPGISYLRYMTIQKWVFEVRGQATWWLLVKVWFFTGSDLHSVSFDEI